MHITLHTSSIYVHPHGLQYRVSNPKVCVWYFGGNALRDFSWDTDYGLHTGYRTPIYHVTQVHLPLFQYQFFLVGM